jgi:hypothetical protein
MSFLPFVLSLLLILVLASSALFHSFRTTSVEKTIILAEHKARFGLIKLEEKRKISKLKKTKKKLEPSALAQKAKIFTRHQRKGYDASKLSLGVLWTKSDPVLYSLVYESAIRLIENLYKEADFYKEMQDKDLARTLVQAMTSQQGNKWLDLIPKDPALAKVYYKMLKGTSTGYPSLEEYFSLKESKPPTFFRYAPPPLLQAIFGQVTSDQILDLEKTGLLSQEKLRDLLQQNPSPLLSINDVGAMFSFNLEKSDPHAFVEPKTKIRVSH